MNEKKIARVRRSKKQRAKIRELGVSRLSISRSPRHIYAQITTACGDKVLASASTLDSSLRSGKTGNIDAAAAVGALIAKKAVEAGLTTVAFDRSGFKYHGRVKALADAARENGLQF